MSKKILIVDDDTKIVELIEIYLKNEGYQLYTANNGQDAINLVEKIHPELMILDIMMPKMDGLEVCKKVRQTNNLPILMLSAKAEDMDKIIGIMTGADDYMIKPFNPLELTVRVKALLRRASMHQIQTTDPRSDCIFVHSLEIDKMKHTVRVEGEIIKLTSLEFEILYLLAKNKGRVFSSEEIFEHVWKEEGYGTSKTVMVHISNLREKIELATNGEKIIQTVWGVGYKIEC